MEQLYKYPRTHHIEGSRLQPGDEDLDQVAFQTIIQRNLVVEEKLDGANCGISFNDNGELLLQSRGHYLTGGHRERHFNLFKQWAATHALSFQERLENRYIMYGEWLYAKHTVYYNALPHYFMEFDIYDTHEGRFLDTHSRHKMLRNLPVQSVPVLFEGTMKKVQELTSLIGPSLYIEGHHIEELYEQARELGLDPDRVVRETDTSVDMEGLYIKVEEDGSVVDRYKFVRAAFLTAVFEAEGHWLNRPIIPNRLQEGVDLFVTDITHNP